MGGEMKGKSLAWYENQQKKFWCFVTFESRPLIVNIVSTSKDSKADIYYLGLSRAQD